jgi:hypothetical protein
MLTADENFPPRIGDRSKARERERQPSVSRSGSVLVFHCLNLKKRSPLLGGYYTWTETFTAVGEEGIMHKS